MKLKRAGILTKIIIIVLAIYASTTLVNLYSQIKTARAEISSLQTSIDDQAATNAELEHILNNSKDPNTLEQIARDRLGLSYPDEQIFNVK